MTALLALDGVEAAVAVVARLRRSLPSLEAAELFLAGGLELVCHQLGLEPPFPERHEAFLLVEAADVRDPSTELARLLEQASEVRHEAVAADAAGREALWRYREGHTEAISRRGTPHKLDVAVPPARVPELARRVRSAVEEVAPHAEVVLFGHAAEGNLHVNVLGPEPHDEDVDRAVLEAVAGLGGTVSAEHGVGVAKARWLPLTRSAAEIEAMLAVKRALDPRGILNPGAVLPPQPQRPV